MRNALHCFILVVGLLLGSFMSQSAVSQNSSPPELSIADAVTALQEGIKYLGGEQQELPSDQSTLDRAQEAYERLFATIRTTDRTCRALTTTMRSPGFAQQNLWSDITKQLQVNSQVDDDIGAQSLKILNEFKRQIPWYDHSPGRLDRLVNYTVDINSPEFRNEVQRYFTDPKGLDVCRVANPFGQLQRFARIQSILYRSNPVLAGKALLVFGPAVLESMNYERR